MRTPIIHERQLMLTGPAGLSNIGLTTAKWQLIHNRHRTIHAASGMLFPTGCLLLFLRQVSAHTPSTACAALKRRLAHVPSRHFVEVVCHFVDVQYHLGPCVAILRFFPPRFAFYFLEQRLHSGNEDRIWIT